MLSYSSIVHIFLRSITCLFDISTRLIQLYCSYHINVPLIACHLCYYISHVCLITGNTMPITIEWLEHHFIQINPLLISNNIHMTSCRQVGIRFATITITPCIEFVRSQITMGHTQCVKSTSCTYWFWFGTNSTTQMIPTSCSGFISCHPFTKLHILLASFHVCIFKESMLILVRCCSFLFLPLDDHRYHSTPCLHQVPNHQQNATTDTDLVDNLKAWIQQPKHND